MVFRRFNRGNRLRPVNRIKHVRDSQFAVGLGVVRTEVIALATDTPTLAVTNSVETGSTINGFFISLEVVNTGTTGVLANAYMMVVKNVGGNLTFPNPNVVGADDNKRYVIHQEMVMLQMIDNSNPRTLFKGVVAIPRGYRRMGPNDSFEIHVFSPGIEVTGCLQVHYKEFR